jgi:predicted O-methyltransferase YrrM
LTFPILQSPSTDPTPIFEVFRGSYATDLLTAAVAHFNVFGRLAQAPLSTEALRSELGLAERPAVVLLTALKAFGLLVERDGRLSLTELAREHVVPGGPFDVSDYVGLVACSPGVLEMVERLKTNRPAGSEKEQTGAAFIYREGIASAMEQEDLARHLTLALAGRARNVAPHLAERVPLDGARLLLDVGGGTGLYSIAFLQKSPNLRAVVLDRPEVLKVASEMAATYGVSNRLDLIPGDMFQDLATWGHFHPSPDAVLLSNVLHDWDVPQCRELIARCATLLRAGGRLLIHDVFLNDALDGPMPIALYSAALFCLTEGRAYSAAEYRQWLTEVGLLPQPTLPTLIHCGVLAGVKA